MKYLIRYNLAEKIGHDSTISIGTTIVSLFSGNIVFSFFMLFELMINNNVIVSFAIVAQFTTSDRSIFSRKNSFELPGDLNIFPFISFPYYDVCWWHTIMLGNRPLMIDNPYQIILLSHRNVVFVIYSINCESNIL